MARLVSYKPKDDNRYCTFKNESSVSYKESDLFKRVELVQRAKKAKRKKSTCSGCLSFWYKLCTCCFCCGCFSRCRKKRCWFCCCSHQNYESDAINEGDIAIRTISCTSINFPMSEVKVHSFNSEKQKSNKSNKKLSSKYWNWNDSLRSNSDKFLETLEYDLDGDRSLKKNRSNRTASKIPLYSGKKDIVDFHFKYFCTYNSFYLLFKCHADTNLFRIP